METSTLLTETRDLLATRTQSLRSIAEKSGINLHWLAKFQQRKFADPGVIKIEKLHRFLTESAASRE